MGQASFGASATLTVSGKIRDLKKVEGKDSTQCTFNIGVRQYRGQDKDPVYANYYMRAFGKQAEKILGHAKDGTFMVCTGSLDQNTSVKNGQARTFNNVAVDSSLIGPDGAGGGAPAKAEPKEDLPF
jgi:hypothetical protein